MPQSKMPVPSRRITRKFIMISPAVWLVTTVLLVIDSINYYSKFVNNAFFHTSYLGCLFGGFLITILVLSLARAFWYFVFEDTSD